MMCLMTRASRSWRVQSWIRQNQAQLCAPCYQSPVRFQRRGVLLRRIRGPVLRTNWVIFLIQCLVALPSQWLTLRWKRCRQ
ncbi:hypothetical protein BT63DRAFT_290316 [Microthyrium microscopicum]|uniref:Uncharacterized protein n=1 Tax=Microthyrium microscopicum TaxID=703497 RepID=A0A6A6U5C2_9PEZI|nr:hypothetical protein BT63DRAFT_290316 [Microthyrium microscopicum]